MLIDDMHIVVSQGYQKINSGQRDNVLPEEMDLALNLAQASLVTDRLPSRVAASVSGKEQEDLYDLRALIVKNHTLTVFVPQPTDADFEPKLLVGLLPPGCRQILSDRSLVQASTRSEQKLKPVNLRLGVLAFPLDTKNPIGSHYQGLQVSLRYLEGVAQNPKSLVLFDSSTTGFAEGIYDSRERQDLLGYLVAYLNQNSLGVRFYWEKFGNKVYPGKLVVLAPNHSHLVTSSLTIRWEGEIFTCSLHPVPNQQYETPKGISIGYRLNTPTQQSLYLLQNNPYGKSLPTAPLSMAVEGKLYIYEGENFIIGGVQIDYIRQPRLMNYREKVNCELSEDLHPEICERAVVYLRQITQGGGSAPAA